MKLKFKMEKEVVTEQEKKTSWTFVFKPTLKQYHKEVTFSISGENTPEIMSNLGLPDEVGDTCVLEMTQKEEQTKLEEKGENGKKA